MRAAYRLWFEQGISNGSDEKLHSSTKAADQGRHVERILAAADGDDVGSVLTVPGWGRAECEVSRSA